MRKIYANPIININRIFFTITVILMLSCQSDKALKEQYRQQGKLIASESFQALSKALSNSMITLGIQQSIDFCHSRAYPITDSLSAVYQAEVKRMALRNRNPENEADELAAQLINHYIQLKSENNDLTETDTIIRVSKDSYRYFKPILLQGQCLVCHGKPREEIIDPVYTLILEKYPNDNAINFGIGDVRGIWSISFKKP
ncbi:MAG: DUF3365 domain-containing protein [Flavobacteriales bacterium]